MVESVPLSRLKPAPWNPRLIRDERFRSLVRSLEADPDFMKLRPILATKDGTIYAGNMRYRAAAKAGWTEVPVIIDDIDELTAKARAVRDNNGWGEWQDEELAELLHGIGDAGIELGDLGFDDKELNRILGLAPTEGLTDPDDVPEPPAEPYVKRGEVYELGDHRLMCGDATDEDDVARLLDGVRPDCVMADPPYGMRLETEFSGMHRPNAVGKGGNDYAPVIGDDADFDPEPVLSILEDVGEQFWWGADYYRACIPAGGGWFVWDKRDNEQGMQLDKLLGSHFELCWSRKAHKREIVRVLWAGHHGMQREDTARRIHPTQKPTELMTWFLERWAPTSVFDPFVGSGTTLIAAEQTGRRCYAMEIDSAYVQITIGRWEAFTGRTARRVADAEAA